MRTLLVSALLAALVVPAGGNAGPSFRYDRELAAWALSSLEVASRVAGSGRKKVPLRTYVRCYADRTAFEAPMLAEGEAAQGEVRSVIAYYDDKGDVHMRQGTCDAARRFVGGHVTTETAGAFKTLLHETLHRQGFANERDTECWAIASTKYAGWLLHWNGLREQTEATWTASERYGDRALMLARASSRRHAAMSYQTPASTCLRWTRERSWADYFRG